MGTDALKPLLFAIQRRLMDEDALRAAIPDPGALVRLPPAQQPQSAGAAAAPALRLLRADSRPWRSATFDGEAHELTFEAAGADRMADGLAERLVAALQDADLPIPGHALIDLDWAHTDTGPPGTRRIWFTARTVSD